MTGMGPHLSKLSIASALSAALAMALAPSASAAPQALVPAPDNGGITLPPGFRALVVADGLGPLRFLTVAANGDVYVKTSGDGIIALRDTSGDGRADVKETFGSGGGTGIAIHDGWLYSSTNSSVSRYRLTPGELVPKGEPETVVSGLPLGPQHEAKSFAFDGSGRLVVEVGSPSNALGDPDRSKGARGKDASEFLKTHGGFWRFDPNRLNQTQADGFHVSTGHRHVLALAWNTVAQAFFLVMMGRDQLSTVDPEHYTDEDNAELPAEEMHVLREGANYGWPYTYWDPIKKARMVAPEYGGDNQKRAEPGKYPDPLIAFPGHWAPLQMAFYQGTQFPARYRGGAFIAFHGSWNRAPKPQKGYNVTYAPFDATGMPVGTYEVFADGFSGRSEFTAPRDARYRPGGVAVGPDGSLYVTDTEKGRVWRIFYAGAARAAGPAANAPSGASPSTAATGPGAQRYKTTCAVCHMQDGSGVPNMQPALDTSAVVKGDPAILIRLLLEGAPKALAADRVHYSNQMPLFASLKDAEIAEVLTYVRKCFGGEPAVTPGQVAALRKAP
jgi:glucose/arabinose dehydrogenase